MASEVEDRARDLHRRGLELMRRGRPAGAARLIRAGLRLLGWPCGVDGSPALVARLLITLAITELQMGRAEHGFALLDTAEPLVQPEQRGVLVQQRGLMLVETGRMEEALRCLNEAIELLNETDEPLVLAKTLLNRAVQHQNTGRVGLARLDLVRCERIARALDEPLLLAKAAYNHAYCDLLVGDIPGTLRHLDVAAEGLAATAADPLLGAVSVYRARALLAAGLYTEAAAELDAAMARPAPRWLSQDLAEGELARAHTALARKDWAAARLWAAKSERRYRRSHNPAWAAVARLARLQANFGRGKTPAATAGDADRLCAELRALGLDGDADAAALLAARAHTAAGRPERARASLRECRPHTLMGNRVQRRLAQAQLSAAGGDRAGVLRNCRLGLATLSRHQSRIGSLDLRTGSAVIGGELAALGLGEALRGGSAPLIFSWLERSRAQSFRGRPVRPPADSRTVEAVAELRHLARVVRTAELSGQPDPAARRRCAELERAIRARGWRVDGTGEGRALASFADVVAELTTAGSALVSFIAHQGQVLALVLTDKGGRLVGLGDWASVTEAVTRLHRDVDALVDRMLPPALHHVIATSASHQATLLADRLLAPVRSMLGDRELVLVPTGTLSAVPWSVLPELRGRPVTVAPSASTWLAGRRGRPTAGAGSAADTPLLVAGPDLRHASGEVHAVASSYRQAIVLTGSAATVDATLRAIDGRSVVHIAAHGHHEQDNVLFSRLDLVDGPLMAYDVQQLTAAPVHVVLPACDIGRIVVRTGDELLGFTAALLYMGTRSVVSCVNRVLDDRAADVMSAYHRALTTGRSPSQALAGACAADPWSPFVCFGSG